MEKSTGRNRLTISLSEKSVQAFKEIRKITDADSDSEVFRNALRLYLGLIRAHQDGKRLYMKDDKDAAMYPMELFLPTT
jgi:metal-responsive CopG/Arc/MetJ family transcriptional regulator